MGNALNTRQSDSPSALHRAGRRAGAAARVHQKIAKLMELIRQKHLTKEALAQRMKTSRAALDRLLDPTNPSVTLATLGKAASALGCTLRIELTHI